MAATLSIFYWRPLTYTHFSGNTICSKPAHIFPPAEPLKDNQRRLVLLEVLSEDFPIRGCVACAAKYL